MFFLKPKQYLWRRWKFRSRYFLKGREAGMLGSSFNDQYVLHALKNYNCYLFEMSKTFTKSKRNWEKELLVKYMLAKTKTSKMRKCMPVNSLPKLLMPR